MVSSFCIVAPVSMISCKKKLKKKSIRNTVISLSRDTTRLQDVKTPFLRDPQVSKFLKVSDLFSYLEQNWQAAMGSRVEG